MKGFSMEGDRIFVLLDRPPILVLQKFPLIDKRTYLITSKFNYWNTITNQYASDCRNLLAVYLCIKMEGSRSFWQMACSVRFKTLQSCKNTAPST